MSHVVPDDSEFLEYRSLIASSHAVNVNPALHLPPARDSAEAAIWQDELLNNELVTAGIVGDVRPISCLDALLFSFHNARVPQKDEQTEFIASILRRNDRDGARVRIVFGAGAQTFPPSVVYGFDVVDRYVAEGWTYWYLLHNHTRQSNGALGVPAPSTSDVRFARALSAERGLERVRVTNGFYTFDAAVEDLAPLRER